MRTEQKTVFRVKEPMELMAFLMAKMDGIRRNKVKAMLTSRSVSVNGKVCSQYNFPLEAGMTVEIEKPSAARNFSSKFVRIVYEDKYLLVVEKREGILTNDPSPAKETVQTILTRYLRQSGQRCSAHVVHRLDRDTSGLLIFTKDKQTELVFESDWKGFVTDRRYVAVVEGRMEAEEGTVRSWLRDNKAHVTYSSDTDNGGKLAVTHYRTLEATDRFSLLELKLDTGRKNQIRVHMQTLGHSVAGDAKYGSRLDPLGRLGLHAFRLAFRHPVTGEPLSFDISWPQSFKKIMQKK